MIRKNDDYDNDDYIDDEPLRVDADFQEYWNGENERLVRYVAEYCADEAAAPGASLWVWEFEAVVCVGDPGGALWVLDVDEYRETLGVDAFRRYLNGEKLLLDGLSFNIALAIADIFEDLGPDA